ncbi:S8 family serine peptidase [Peribacillus sp. RS7]|uniref:S8 family peptidase n=1 Tax=Peribacillus sp. RS7 TaxID=3242679 RepID=UPI0035BF3FF8
MGWFYKKYFFGIFVIVIIIGISIYLFYGDNQKSYENHSKADLEWLSKKDGQLNSWGRESLKLEVENVEDKQMVKVAILDSGIEKKHEDLVGRVVREYNAINPQEKVEDIYGHGTAVAGIIAANNNTLGIKGIVPNIDIYSIKVLSDNGKGNIEALSKGIDWAIKNNVDLINISFGMPYDKPELKKVINKAVEAGIIIVASAGNKYGLKSDYPASYDNVISVNAVTADLKIASFSAKGKIDFVGPGVDIITTTSNNNYGHVEGTSIAAAYVTGSIANLLTHKNKFNIPDRYDPTYHDKVYKVLKKKSLELGDENIYGHGLIQL